MTSKEAFYASLTATEKWMERPSRTGEIVIAKKIWQAACEYQKRKDAEIVRKQGYDPDTGQYSCGVGTTADAILNQDEM